MKIAELDWEIADGLSKFDPGRYRQFIRLTFDHPHKLKETRKGDNFSFPTTMWLGPLYIELTK